MQGNTAFRHFDIPARALLACLEEDVDLGPVIATFPLQLACTSERGELTCNHTI